MRFSNSIICLLFLASVAFAAPTFMNVDYPFHFDNQGYVQFSAHAGVNQSSVVCNDTNVSVSINNVDYALDSFIDCRFSKLLFLPNGEHTIVFTAEFDDYKSLTASYYLNVTQMPDNKIFIYSPENGSTYRKDDMIFIDSTGVPYGVFSNSEMNATIMRNGKAYSSAMIQNEDGIFKKYL